METMRTVHQAWLVVRRSVDVPGDWEAHCLDFDLVAQGERLVDAVLSVLESARITITEDHKADHDPYARRAPPEYWGELQRVLADGIPIPARALLNDAPGVTMVAMNLPIDVALNAESVQPEPLLSVAQKAV